MAQNFGSNFKPLVLGSNNFVYEGDTKDGMRHGHGKLYFVVQSLFTVQSDIDGLSAEHLSIENRELKVKLYEGWFLCDSIHTISGKILD